MKRTKRIKTLLLAALMLLSALPMICQPVWTSTVCAIQHQALFSGSGTISGLLCHSQPPTRWIFAPTLPKRQKSCQPDHTKQFRNLSDLPKISIWLCYDSKVKIRNPKRVYIKSLWNHMFSRWLWQISHFLMQFHLLSKEWHPLWKTTHLRSLSEILRRCVALFHLPWFDLYCPIFCNTCRFFSKRYCLSFTQNCSWVRFPTV